MAADRTVLARGGTPRRVAPGGYGGNLELAARVGAKIAEAARGLDRLERAAGRAARRVAELAEARAETGAARPVAGAPRPAPEAAEDPARAPREWRDNARRAFDDMAAGADSAGERIGEAMGGAFRTMERALAGFVASGRLDFRAFVDDILGQLARIAVRRAVVAPLAAALEGLFGSALGAGGSGIGAAVAHGGAVAGAPGGVRRSVPPALFAAAPRLHGGGIAGLRSDEVPAILQRGEVVLPRAAGVARAAGPPAVHIEIRNEGTPQHAAAREPRFDGERWVIGVVTRDLDRGGPIRAAVDRAAGPAGGAL